MENALLVFDVCCCNGDLPYRDGDDHCDAHRRPNASRAVSLRCNSSTTNRHLTFSAMTSQYFIVGMMPNLESFDGFSVQLLGNQLCALGLSDG